jgi:hypothetical protein
LLGTSAQNARVANALSAEDSSARLQAALAIGSAPDIGFLETLVERCSVEPDFFVQDMLSWAWITRDMLCDADDEVARTAWRVAVLLVPEGEKKDLADARSRSSTGGCQLARPQVRRVPLRGEGPDGVRCPGQGGRSDAAARTR